jgi:hypothetical protein
MPTRWLSENTWTGADPSAAELEEVERWQRRIKDYRRLKRLGMRVQPPQHPFFRAGDIRQQERSRSDWVPLIRLNCGRIVDVR